MRRFITSLIFLFLLSLSITAQPFTKKYIMAFHTCDGGCTDPRNHTIRLAESDDGTAWTFVPNFQPYSGSVPDAIIRGTKLYLYDAGSLTLYDRITNIWSARTSIQLKDGNGNDVRATDPSLIIDDQGRIVLFFLNSTGLVGDPAGCTTYPCTKNFDSAVEVAGSDGKSFVVQNGPRATRELYAGAASDPDIFFDGTNYYMYISMGQTTVVYSSSTLHGSYSLAASLQNGILTDEGGVPCGYFDPISHKYWTYVNRNQPDGNKVINLAIHDNYNSKLLLANFTTVISGKNMGLDPWVYAESPGFCVNDFLNQALPPYQVHLVSPLNNANISQSSVNFIWQKGIPDVTKYWFEYADNENMTNPTIDSSFAVNDTSKTIQLPPDNKSYWWRVKAKNTAGWGSFSEKRNFSINITDVKNEAVPLTTELYQNYPNPFNPATVISYQLSENSFVRLIIYDALGNEIETVVNKEQPAGSYNVKWKPQNISTGFYFYRLITDKHSDIKKMIFMK